MTKRKTQKELQAKRERGWLRQRLSDIAYGANGGYEPEDDPENGIGVFNTMAAVEFGDFIAAVEVVFNLGTSAPGDNCRRRTATAPRSLQHFDTLDKLTTWLIDCGVRYDD